MKLIEDLGMQEYGTQGRMQPYGIYECPECKKHFRCVTINVTNHNTTRCKQCANIEIANNKIATSALTFVKEATEVHGTKYDYSVAVYLGARKHIAIKCHTHGIFTQTPGDHKAGKGCPACSGNIRGTTKNFIEEATQIHGEKYNYDLVEYKNNNTAVLIVCKIHGQFSQTPSAHKNSGGCPSCASAGFDRNKSAILYYVKVLSNGILLYKIGITNRTVKARFTKDDFNKITILKTWEFVLGKDAWDKEQEILALYKDVKYKGVAILASGNTELFTHDVLGLDYGGTPESLQE